MDRITKQLLNDFLASQEVPATTESEDFEKFCNYTVITDEYNRTFDVDQISIGSGNDTGLDGIAVLVNGHIVEDTDEVDDLLENNGFLDVTYIFIQAKTSSSFDTKEMHSFYFGVTDFFSEEPKLPRNDEIKRFAEISNHIINNASDFKQNPTCKTFYITTGVYNESDANLAAATATAKENLNSYNLFDSIENDIPNLFSVLNNGITVVANSIKTAGNNLTISDYQIVNGCQTSNVLYESRSIENMDSIVIPLRLIVTDNEDVKAKITVSTNSQTAIRKEQLSAMSDFQKNLEYYYSTIEGDGKLYYERRAKQYNSDRNVVKRKIITVPIQIKAYLSMFNKNPHMVTSYFGGLVKNVGEQGSKIFEPDHQFAAYYLAGLTFYRLDGLFNSGDIDTKYRKVKFYLTMLVPLIASDQEAPPLNSQKKVEAYCTPMIEKLNNDHICKQIFETATAIIDRSGAEIEDKQAVKSKLMTEQILATYEGEKSDKAL